MTVVTGRRSTAKPPALDLSWAEQAACKYKRDFLDRPTPEQDRVCRGCPVRRDCSKAGLRPRQIRAMP